MLRIFLLNSFLNCLLSEPTFARVSTPDDTLHPASLVLTFLKRNKTIKEVRLPYGSHIEISLRTPKDSLIDYYDHTVEGKLIACTDSTFTLAATGSYRYINYSNGSWLEDYFDYPADSVIPRTIRMDSVNYIHSSREWLNQSRKICWNLSRIFIGISTINALSGNGNATNNLVFSLGVGAIFAETALSGKKYWVEPVAKQHFFRKRKWQVHSE